MMTKADISACGLRTCAWHTIADGGHGLDMDMLLRGYAPPHPLAHTASLPAPPGGGEDEETGEAPRSTGSRGSASGESSRLRAGGIASRAPRPRAGAERDDRAADSPAYPQPPWDTRDWGQRRCRDAGRDGMRDGGLGRAGERARAASEAAASRYSSVFANLLLKYITVSPLRYAIR